MALKKCNWCNEVAELSCSNCSGVFYCNKEHQKKHWPQHKETCKPYKEKKDSTQGRYLVASRFLKAGTLVMKESPMVVGPPCVSPLVCLGCHIPIIENNFHRCPDCSWPMCSVNCSKSTNHADECKLMAADVKKSGVPVKQGDTPRYDLILILRCLLLKTLRPSDWQKLLQLESHEQRRKDDTEPHHVAAVRFISEVYKLDFDVDTIHQVRGIVVTNSIKTKNTAGITLRGIFPTISLLNHSCLPNLTLRSTKDQKLYIRTTVDVKKDDHLVFSYVPVEDPIWRRQEDLKNIYYFDCQCKRCVDPTELNIFFSSPKCQSCSACLEIANPIEKPWTCKKCGTEMKLKDILKETQEFSEWLNHKSFSLKHLRLFLKSVDEKVHKNHFQRLEVLQKILTFLKDFNTTQEAVEIKVEIWKELIRIHDVIEPGLTRKKGISLIELATAILEKSEKDKSMSTSERNSDCQNLIGICEQFTKILSLEPPHSTERHWVEIGCLMKINIEALVKQLS